MNKQSEVSKYTFLKSQVNKGPNVFMMLTWSPPSQSYSEGD